MELFGGLGTSKEKLKCETSNLNEVFCFSKVGANLGSRFRYTISNSLKKLITHVWRKLTLSHCHFADYVCKLARRGIGGTQDT